MPDGPKAATLIPLLREIIPRRKPDVPGAKKHTAKMDHINRFITYSNGAICDFFQSIFRIRRESD